MTTVSEKLDQLTRPGELYEKLENGAVRCYACGHRCLIKLGRRGICQVRYNEDGELRVPWGYVAALQVDPIEKKPFSHLYPGSDALTFGMLGCDFHCGYCFPGDTVVMTNQGPMPLSQAFEMATRIVRQPDAEIGFPEGLQAITSQGEYRPVRAVFRHAYRGELVVIQPYYFPELRCTPDHKIYATIDPACDPAAIPARELTDQHYLVVPRRHTAGSSQTLDLSSLLKGYETTHKVRWDLSKEDLLTIQTATERGETSRQIGAAIGKEASYVRHVRSKMARGMVHDLKTRGPVVEEGRLRFSHEHRPGIPAYIALDESMARLLGYYCAEGSVVQSRKRPNSLVLNFSFSHRESHLTEEVLQLLRDTLHLDGRCVTRETTLSVVLSKASAALMFMALCGKGAAEKRIPEALFNAPPPVIQAFLNTFVAGDGHVYENGKVSITTISSELAYGIAYLVMKLGFLPSVYQTDFPSQVGMVQGRKDKRAPNQYTVVWYEMDRVERKYIKTENSYLIPLRGLTSENFSGQVYNMEVEEIHNYLAGFLLVSNCQNWITSQVGRDKESDIALSSVQKVSPDDLVKYAQASGAGVVVSSYNEPLITSEWAVDVFKQALQAGLKCAYVSNGNSTPEVLQYLRPYLSGYKIDLKTMQDKQYRKLGGVLQHVLDTIQSAHDLGLWVEVVTLIVPGFNDSVEELWDAARFLTSVSPDIPWHVTAYHPDYKMDADYTPSTTLLKAAEIGQEAGLSYVYAGNLPGKVGTYEDTFCSKCNHRLIERRGYVVRSYHITADGKCPKCGSAVPGVWTDKPETVRLSGPGYPRRAHLNA